MLVPYICLPDTRAGLDWYREALGAVVTVEPVLDAEGRVGHAEFEVSGCRVMASDAHPELQVVTPSVEGVPVTLVLDVDDVDRLAARAGGLGASIDRGPIHSGGLGRICVLRDPFGHRWFLMQPTEKGL